MIRDSSLLSKYRLSKMRHKNENREKAKKTIIPLEPRGLLATLEPQQRPALYIVQLIFSKIFDCR